MYIYIFIYTYFIDRFYNKYIYILYTQIDICIFNSDRHILWIDILQIDIIHIEIRQRDSQIDQIRSGQITSDKIRQIDRMRRRDKTTDKSDRSIYRWMDGWMDRQIDRQIDPVDRQIDPVERQIDPVDRQIDHDRSIDRS